MEDEDGGLDDDSIGDVVVLFSTISLISFSCLFLSFSIKSEREEEDEEFDTKSSLVFLFC